MGAETHLPGVQTWDWLLWHALERVIIVLAFQNRTGALSQRAGAVPGRCAWFYRAVTEPDAAHTEELVACRDREQERTVVSR